MTPTEALARIAALCEQSPAQLDVDREAIVAVLADVTPEAGGTLDRDQARDVLRLATQGTYAFGMSEAVVIDRLAGCVRPVAGVTLTAEERAGIEWLLLQMTDAQKREAPSAPWRGLQSLAARLEAASPESDEGDDGRTM